MTPGSFRVEPGDKMGAAVEFDPSAEPDFRGGLSIDVTGYAAGGVAFHTLVRLEVKSDPPDEIGDLVP